jgi:hypothetical protein
VLVVRRRSQVNAPPLRAPVVSELLRACEFIGVSAYAPLNGASFQPQALQASNTHYPALPPPPDLQA